MQAKILYISYDGMTDPLGQSQVISYMKGLSDLGHRFHVISFEKETRFLEKQQEIRAVFSKHGIEWCPMLYTKRPPVLSTIADVFRMHRTAKRLQRQHAFEIVHCRSYIASLVGLSLKRRYTSSLRFIFDMRGFWIEERVDGKMWNLDRFLFRKVYNYFKKKEAAFLSESDQVVILTNAGKKFLVNERQIDADKIGVVPTCVDFKIFKITTESEQRALRAQLGIGQATRVFLYAGAVGGSYDMSIVFRAYTYYRSYYKDTHLLLLTKDAVSVSGSSLLRENDIQKDRLSIVESPFMEVYRYLNISDVGFVFYSDGWSNIARSPTKMGEYLACGLPVIVQGSIGDIDTLVDSLEIYKPLSFSEASYHACFARMDAVKRDVSAIRQGSFDYCSLESGVAFYDELYQKSLGT